MVNGAGRWQLLWLLQLLLSNCADSVVDEEVNVKVEGGGGNPYLVSFLKVGSFPPKKRLPLLVLSLGLL